MLRNEALERETSGGFVGRTVLKAARKEARQSEEEDRLLKVDEVAARLRLSRSAVYNLIKRGALPYLNVACGNRIAPRVHASDLR